MKPPRVALVLTCEHASARIPAGYARLFRSARARTALASHRGFDIGSLTLARRIARHFGAELKCAAWSRLLVDLNRSVRHRNVFSEFTRMLGADERRDLVSRHRAPYRAEVEAAVRRAIAARHFACHIAVHSFTPVLGRERRTADVGLLYDPGRQLERELCRRWQLAFEHVAPALRVRRNYPYHGTADGLTTALRRRFADTEYAGIELEVSQALLSRAAGAAETARAVIASLDLVLGGRLPAVDGSIRAARAATPARARSRRRS